MKFTQSNSKRESRRLSNCIIILSDVVDKGIKGTVPESVELPQAFAPESRDNESIKPGIIEIDLRKPDLSWWHRTVDSSHK